MTALTVKLDTRPLEQWALQLSATGLRNAIRRAVDQSARAARKVAIGVIAADIGVSKARIKEATPKVRASTASDLSARWTISKSRIGILNVSGVTISKGVGLNASTHRLTGGGSASLHVEKAFVVNTRAGGHFVAIRKAASKYPIKAIFAEMPNTAMAQDGAAARKTWQSEASHELSTRLPVEVAKQLVREGLGPSSPISDED